MRLILGRRRNKAGVLVLAAVPMLLAIALRASDPSSEGDGPDLISAATSNGVFVALTALTVEMALFLPLAVAVLSGDTVAGEANIGTLRYLLTVPVGRTRLLVREVPVPGGRRADRRGRRGRHRASSSAVRCWASAPRRCCRATRSRWSRRWAGWPWRSLYVTAGLAGLAAIGLFVSTLTEQPIAAMVTTTIISSAMWIMDGIPQLDWLAPWLLVHRWAAFVDLFRDPVFADVMRTGLLVDLGYIVVFLALAWARFANKDVTS